MKERRGNIDMEIKQLTRNAKVNDELRRELFGAVAVCPKIDEDFGAKNLFWEMGLIFNRYKKHKDGLKHMNNAIRAATFKLYVD